MVDARRVLALALGGALVAGGLLAGCRSPSRDGAKGVAPTVAASGLWAAASANDVDAVASAPPPRGDPRARAELLAAASAHAPSASPPRRPPGGDTGLPGSGDVELDPPRARAPTPVASSGAPTTPSPDAIERAARASLYWELTQRCRGEDGAILPSESVELMFEVDEDGYLVVSTISAVTKQHRFERAALCMRRELARSAFRAPPSARGARTQIKLWVPSTD